jgi:diguanylate cyclase (GGDEF)-like protein
MDNPLLPGRADRFAIDLKAGRLAALLQHTPLRSPMLRVWSFTALLAAAATIAFLGLVVELPRLTSAFEVPWLVIAGLFALAELLDVQVHFRRETHAFSLSEVPAVLGLFLLEPVSYMAALLLGSGVALVLQSREHPLKIAFNLSNFALTGTIAIAIFRALAPAAETVGPVAWIAAFVAMLTASVIAATNIAAAISLSGGAPQFQKLPEMIQFGGLVALANTSLALLAVTVLWVDPTALWLLTIPLATLLIAYRAYVSEREKHERLELLYESSRILQNSPELDSALVALLHHAREMFRAEVAELVVYPRRNDDPAALRTRSLLGAEAEVMAPLVLSPADPIRRRVAVDPRPFFHVPDPGSRFSGPPIRQAMTSPLTGERGLVGELTVANRLTEGTSFGDDDLRLLEMIAAQATAALENGRLEQSLAELSRLKEQLRHQAYHDSLTGLPNRAHFAEQIDLRLAGPRGTPTSIPVVLFLDLDDFKEVNDTLGHAAGDRLLVLVAARISAAVRTSDLAARLGGDEFAVLIEDEPDLRDALAIANRILDLLKAPFHIEDREIVVGGSVGIAVARDRSERAADLLRQADMAMYTAKAEGKRRVTVFDPTVHASIVARHELSRELARSVSRGEFMLHYQPILDLRSGQLVGIESLVRWRHPVHGLVGPDEFIRLAEDNGTILELGRWVVAESCRQAAAWHTSGDLPESAFVSVNLSPHQVRQTDFESQLIRLVEAARLDPTRLVLELTETAMFGDVEATIGRLEGLRRLGIRVAVDDFGTGYSSLGYLRKFPVDILKIAREFVVPEDSDPGEWAFAHAIVALGRTLGLTIVAEGVEARGQHDRLRELGCDQGQGFLLGRPMMASEFEAWARIRKLGLSEPFPVAGPAATPDIQGRRGAARLAAPGGARRN